jgi:hypothetical protein
VEVLQKRDAEMTEFISKFDATKAAVMSDQQRAQDTVVALLQHISSGLEAQHNMPAQSQVRACDPPLLLL